MFNKVKEQIARQTRDKLGFVDIQSFRGIKQSLNTIKTQGAVLPNPGKFLWWKYHYFYDRSSITNGILFNHPVPVLSLPRYADIYPSHQYLTHYYSWGDPNTNQVSPGSLQIDGGLSGSFTDYNLTHALNASYTISIPGDGTLSFTNLSIGTEDLSLSVWARVYKGGFPEILLLYSSEVNGLVNSWANIQVPVGNILTQLFIMVYNHNLDVKWKPGYRWNGKEWLQSGSPEISPPPLTDNFIAIQANFDVLNHYTSQTPSNTLNVPDWASTPITNTTDAVTGNSVNVLDISKPSNENWKSISVYRKNYYENIPLINNSDNNFAGNTIIVGTSNANIFPNQSKVIFNNTSEPVRGSFNIYANKIKNSDFSSYTGGILNNWIQRATAVGAFGRTYATSYAWFRDYRSNGSCWKIESYKTNTAKSYYLETNYYISTAQNDFLSFCYNLNSGQPTGRLKAMYYSSSNGTFASVSSASWFFDSYSNYDPLSGTASSRNWSNFKAQLLKPTSDSLGIKRPSNCAYYKIRLYGSLSSTSYSCYLFDNVHLGERGSQYLFDTSSINRVGVSLDNNYEKSRNYLTSINSYFHSSTVGVENSTPYANAVFGRPQYVDSAWDEFIGAKFQRGIKLVSSAKNYFANGDFRGGGRYWTSANGFNYSLSGEPSLFYANNYVRFTGSSIYSYISQSTGEPGMVGNSSFSLAVWAKSRIDRQPLRLLLSNTYFTQVSSADFNLSSVWNKYQINKKFTAPGHTVVGRLIVPTNKRTWELDVSGAQVEPKFISDFNYYDTTQGSQRNAQGLRYLNATASGYRLNQQQGTIRMWYTPLINSDTGPGLRYFYQYFPGGVYFRTIYWNKSNNTFVYQYNSGGLKSTVNSTYQSGDKIHIVGTWDTSGAVLYINGIPGNKIANNVYSTGQATHIYVGYNILDSQQHEIDGILSDFRIDRSPWTYPEIIKDYYADKVRYVKNRKLKATESVFVGEKQINKNDPSIKFTDDQGLSIETKYNYVFRTSDENGYQSPESIEQSIVTKRRPYEYSIDNKIPNGSFEVLNYFNGKPLYWSSAGTKTSYCSINSGFYFNGKKSVQLVNTDHINNDWGLLESEYITISNTSSPHYLSWFNIGGSRMSSASVYFYDSRFNQIGMRTATAGNMSTSYHLGLDSNIWQRFSTSFGKSNLAYNTANSTKYWKIILGVGRPHHATNTTIYIDGIQVEEQSLRAYREGYFVGGNNLPSGSIKGNAIAFDALVGRHLQAGELVISGHSSDANRILIGVEKNTESFSELKNDHFRWHSPGLPTSAGWNYAKHIESGIARFGDNVPFDYKYYNWNGTSTDPLVLVTPKDIVTFSTANMPVNYSKASVFAQNLNIIINATSGGFTANAAIYKRNTGVTNQNLNYFWHKNVNIPLVDDYHSQTTALLDDLTTPSYESTLTTVLPLASRSQFGTFYYSRVSYNQPSPWTHHTRIRLYCTSQVATTFAVSSWRMISSTYSYFSNGTLNSSRNINSSHFSRAKSFSIRVQLDSVNPNTSVYTLINPTTLTYTATSISVLLQDSAVGTFSWISLDGGILSG